MDDYYDWNVETDGLPPADSSIAQLFEETAPPHEAYVLVEPQVKSPAMGDVVHTWTTWQELGFFLGAAALGVWMLIMLIIWRGK